MNINWTGGRDSICSVEDAYITPDNESTIVEPSENKVPLEGPSVQVTDGALGVVEEVNEISNENFLATFQYKDHVFQYSSACFNIKTIFPVWEFPL